MSTSDIHTADRTFVPSVFPKGWAVLYGRTRAEYGSPVHQLTLAGATLIFYEAEGESPKSRTRWGFRPAAGGSVQARELGRARVADDGRFAVGFEGEPPRLLLVAISVEKFAYAPATGKTAFGLLGVAAPEWRGGVAGTDATADIHLGHVAYCGILEALDLWLVAGRVTDCANSAVGLPGGTVQAFDRDLSQDDLLGSDTTDAGGNFQIFFSSPAFKGVPVLPPPFDVIPPHELIGGPDVFFKVTHGGSPVLEEAPSAGRQSGRENVGHCSYHALCVRQIPIPAPQTITLWAAIGEVEIPDSGGLRHFDADGLTASGKAAFTGHLDFNGQVSQKYLGEAVSYRFVFAEWANLAVPPAYPAAYQPLLGANLDLGARYGSLYTFVGPSPWDYSTTPVLPAPDTDGWITVDESPNFIRDVDRMVRVRSETLVPQIAPAGFEGTDNAGVAVPAGPLRDRPRKFSFVLEIKTASTSAHQPVPVPIHLNNSPAYMHFELQELEANACTSLSSAGGSITVHPKFTVAHPYLSSYDVSVQRQGGTLQSSGSDTYTAHGPLWTDADGEFGTLTTVYTDVGPCSYRAYMNCHRRLTNGYGGPGGQHALRTFCVD